jgi:hypothetical protein
MFSDLRLVFENFNIAASNKNDDEASLNITNMPYSVYWKVESEHFHLGGPI